MNFFNKIFSRSQAIAIRTEDTLYQLKLEAKELESKLNNCINEKAELEKLLGDFQYRHTMELGDLILEILRLKQMRFELNTQEFKDAENDANKYYEQFKLEKKKQKNDLNEAEKLELKKLFRKASFLCHPDKIIEDLKEEASKVFRELKAAYEENDLLRVSEILARLESGTFFNSISENVSEKENLLILIQKIKSQISELENEIILIKRSDTYKTITVIDDLDSYFINTKENLRMEIEEMKSNLVPE